MYKVVVLDILQLANLLRALVKLSEEEAVKVGRVNSEELLNSKDHSSFTEKPTTSNEPPRDSNDHLVDVHNLSLHEQLPVVQNIRRLREVTHLRHVGTLTNTEL